MAAQPDYRSRMRHSTVHGDWTSFGTTITARVSTPSSCCERSVAGATT